MKGTVVSTWLKTCNELYGKELVNDALTQANISTEKTFTPLEEVSDELVSIIMNHIAKEKNVALFDLWETLGKHNLKTFQEDYPAFFRQKNLFNFLKSMNDVHKIVMKRIPGAKPPILDLETVSSKEAYFTYHSKRGMFGYFSGLLKGAAEHFNEVIEIEEVYKTDNELKLKLTFEKNISYKKSFVMNKILSFGLIKDYNVKVALLTTLFTLGSGLVLSTALENTQLLVLGIGVLAFAFSFVSSRIMNKPMQYILKELEGINEHNYAELIEVKTKDQYEKIFESINQYKDIVKKDFVGFKGIVDEMDTFSDTISEIALTMDVTSDEISDIVEQLASAAQSQAEDTESSVYVLNNNIQEVKNIAKEEQDNKVELEDAVNKIEESFKKVEYTAKQVNDVLNKFRDVKESGLKLRNSAQSITNIVALVSSISQQTNLLALNASIEAARAGEAGKGFAVVADEVRQLSEETNDAVEKINTSLGGFVNDIAIMVEDVDQQYNVLSEENKNLSDAVDTTDEANERIKSVSEKLIDTAKKLEKESNSISSVFQNIESLAAIAEENSASSEQVSSNVTSYAEQIKELSSNVNEFKKITESFKEDLNSYKI
ncbi:methyl-accepting chemotaxis protein [Natranaerovirga hydrolytica]|uniref:Methyl-accepting chemotaxis protein n=1 Tax=Natranaerovirga hydrolytica TaxID=680378 RepID=A0A4R1MX05_9FIRM|nr:heme NO-binding domain-containing protein [Natranaerovirga hydrolytica]TCK97726.1 methyl-accepting chemotaxis protein [Natranaerovirga hydrolytica]